MLVDGALGDDAALLGAEKIGERRAAQIDHEVPTRAGGGEIKPQPVAGEGLLVERNEPVKPGHRLE